MEKPQRPLACVRCHRRRQKCEGRSAGLACLACRKIGCPEECQPISSKRTRGKNGRYTSAPEQRILPNIVACFTPSHAEDDAEHGSTMDSSIEPQANTKLVHLFQSDEDGHGEVRSNLSNLSLTTNGQYAVSHSAAEARSPENEDTWYSNYILSHGPNREAPKSTSSVSTPEHHYTSCQSSSRRLNPQIGNIATPVSLPPKDILLPLLDNYFTRFHVLFPVVNRTSFMNVVQANTVSQTLLRAILFVSTIHCDIEHIHRMGFSNRISAQDFFFAQASCAWDMDSGSDRASLMLAAFHMHFWFGDPTSHRDGLSWLATAIRHAQCMRYHRRAGSQSDIDISERRRIWWCLYIRDRQVALSTGAPVIIHDLECDVEPLQAYDVAELAPFSARYLLLQTELTQTASQLYFNHCSPARICFIEDPAVLQEVCLNIESSFASWERRAKEQGMWNESQPLGIHLMICYHYYFINLLRRIQRYSPSNNNIKSMIAPAASQIRRLVEDFLLQFKAEQFPMIVVSAILCAMSFHTADVQTEYPDHNLVQHNVRPFLVCLRQFEPVYILARWVRNLFTRILRKKCGAQNESRYTAYTAKSAAAVVTTPQDGQIAMDGSIPTSKEAPHEQNNTNMADLTAGNQSICSASQDLFMSASIAEPPDIAFSDWFSFLESTDYYTAGNPALGLRSMDDVQPDILQGMCHAPSYT